MSLNGVKHIVFSSDVEGSKIVKRAIESGLLTYKVEDARSAVYYATGIAAQNKELVVVLVNGSNASRSAFTGMTEAFYRRLPVVLISVGECLDYSTELGDVVFGHYKVSDVDDIIDLLGKELPIHVELLGDKCELAKENCNVCLDLLSEVLTEEDYLYIGNNITSNKKVFPCKFVYGGMPNCFEGAVANVLGASLANKRDRYIGIVSEAEFLHDMNSLGNININDRLMYIVVSQKENNTITNYANALGFDVCSISEKNLNKDIIAKYVHNSKMTVMSVYKECE